MEYEELLEEALKNVKSNGDSCANICERFELKKVEGHHEGSRTVISNFGQIVACLRRDKEHVAKFLFKSLATSGYIDGDRLIFDRKISSKDMNNRIERYVKQFVCCSNCRKPDTEVIEEGGKVYLRCMACGKKTLVHKI
jgi:translation initiation factor 2 subunit 2